MMKGMIARVSEVRGSRSPSNRPNEGIESDDASSFRRVGRFALFFGAILGDARPMRPSDHVMEALRWLGSLSPTRLTGTADERRVHEAIAERLEPIGCRVEVLPFRFPRHIYGSLALHFGLAAGCAFICIPWIAAAAHLVIAGSFYSEVVLRRHVLRTLWPKVETRNVLATFDAPSGEVRRRIVCLAHVDSAYTGFMFNPRVLRTFAAPPPPWLSILQKQLLLPFAAVLGLGGYELAAAFVALPDWPRWVLAVLPAIVFLLNADVVIRNRPVPGAADNLTGCAAQLVLAAWWAGHRTHDDVELVFAFTGAEEAGTGGAAELARTMRQRWPADRTVVVTLDTLSNGTLHVLEEGELFRESVPEELLAAVAEAAEAADHPAVGPYVVPAGATDALPFLVAGYRALALTCVDPEQHAPRHYHHPSDTVENVDPEQLARSVDVAERLLTILAGR